MRALLMAAVLPLLLLAPPAWAINADSGQTLGTTQENDQAVQPGDRQGGANDEAVQPGDQGDGQTVSAERLPLLVPVDEMNDFAGSLSPSLAQDIEVTSPPQVVSIDGNDYGVVIVPMDRLDDLHRDIGQKPVHDHIKVILAEGDTATVADLPTLEMALGIPGMNGEETA